MADDAGSTVPRRQLGRYLRQLREESGVTLDAAAEELECSRQKIWRIEHGAIPVRAVDVRAMCDLYKATPEMTAALTGLARETKAKGWWQAYGDVVPHWFNLYVGLEGAASRLRYYAPELIPGLLQTEAYAMELFRVNRPELPKEDVERQVAVRLQRQALLDRRLPAAPELSVVLSEAALRRGVPDREIMTEQLHHVAVMSTRANITVRVLPLSAWSGLASEAGAFVILDFPEGGNGKRDGEPTTVYAESLTGALYLDKPTEIAEYERAWAGTLAQSLDQDQSRKLIASIYEELRQCTT